MLMSDNQEDHIDLNKTIYMNMILQIYTMKMISTTRITWGYRKLQTERSSVVQACNPKYLLYLRSNSLTRKHVLFLQSELVKHVLLHSWKIINSLSC